MTGIKQFPKLFLFIGNKKLILSQTSVSDSSLLGTPFCLSHLSIQISLPPVMRESLNLRGEGHFSSYGIHPPTNGKSSLQHCSQVIIWFLMKTHSDGVYFELKHASSNFHILFLPMSSYQRCSERRCFLFFSSLMSVEQPKRKINTK